MFEQMNNNKVVLLGKIVSVPKISHQVYEENFYELDLEVERLSNSVDVIPVLMSDKLVNENDLSLNKMLAVSGQFRSYNKQVDGKSKLVLTVFVREMLSMEEVENPNTIELVGFVCKNPIFRTTPFKREICDVLIAVNRNYNKSDYLPCIAWGRNARFAKMLEVGDKVSIFGRIQSREYEKKFEDGSSQKRTAYEISIIKLKKADELAKQEDDILPLVANQSLSQDSTNSVRI